VRRVAAAQCRSTIPRSAPVPNYNAAVDDCEFDSDCGSAPYAHCGVREGGFAHACVEGCLSDPDCGSGRICLCGEAIGRCVPAACTLPSDCGADLDCAAYESAPGCFSTRFACQTPGDVCIVDADCTATSPNAAFCVLQAGARACSIEQCTTP
jgi:hypothetical protein